MANILPLPLGRASSEGPEATEDEDLSVEGAAPLSDSPSMPVNAMGSRLETVQRLGLRYGFPESPICASTLFTQLRSCCSVSDRLSSCAR